MALGVLHFSFLWHGDIIFVYGLFGLLLIPFFFRADRTLRIWTRVVFLVTSAILLIVAALLFVAEQFLTEEALQTSMELKLDEVLLNGSFIEAIPARLEVWAYGISTGIILQGGFAFAAFLLGLRMARTQFLTSPIDVNQNSKLIKRGLLLGAPIQILAALALVQNEQSADPSEAVYLFALTVSFIAAPLLSMFFVGVIRKLVEEKPNYCFLDEASRTNVLNGLHLAISDYLVDFWSMGIRTVPRSTNLAGTNPGVWNLGTACLLINYLVKEIQARTFRKTRALRDKRSIGKRTSNNAIHRTVGSAGSFHSLSYSIC
jgi:hypothetical protein